MKPEIIVGPAEGHHNTNTKDRAYRDQSTVMVVPTRGRVPARVCECLLGLMAPMNQPFTRIFVSGMEVGAAYDEAVATILAHPQIKDFKYLLTVEEDNLPPPDGLIKLLDSIGDYAALGGLYFTKGEGGQPMAYGKPGEMPEYAPWLPPEGEPVPVNGIGMGFSLIKLDVFRDMERPYFQTLQRYDPNSGVAAASQDLHFCGRIREMGHKVAVAPAVKVGHLDPESGIVW
jgi:hypothetical protein